jgi:hypothetical protein
MTLLQLGKVQMHRSVLEAMKYAGLTKNKQLHALVRLPTVDFGVDNIKHTPNPGLCTDSKAEMKAWAYMMTQCNLKPGLHKSGAHGAAAVVKELTKLH